MGKKFYLDMLERVLWTAIQSGGAAWLATGLSFDALTLKVAGGAALASAVKCLVASRVGDSSSAAAMPGVDGG
jgi:hypothetical protein